MYYRGVVIIYKYKYICIIFLDLFALDVTILVILCIMETLKYNIIYVLSYMDLIYGIIYSI